MLIVLINILFIDLYIQMNSDDSIIIYNNDIVCSLTINLK